ncbi:MAG: hypothetical protein ACK50Q_16105 [Labrys sp. (in: a-proteobacteria)]
MSRTTSRITSAASDNPTLIRAGDTRLAGYNLVNTAANTRYVKLYDKATAPNNGDTPFLTIAIPAGSTVDHMFGKAGLRLNNGLGLRIVAGLPDNDSTAVVSGDVLAQVIWERA